MPVVSNKQRESLKSRKEVGAGTLAAVPGRKGAAVGVKERVRKYG